MNPPAKVSVIFWSSSLKGAVRGVTHPTLSTSSWKMGRKGKFASVRDHFTTAHGLDGAALGADTARRAQALPAPWREVHGEVGHTPLGGVPVLREEEKDTDVAVRDVLLALLIEALCINRERIQQRSEMVFLSRKLNI